MENTSFSGSLASLGFQSSVPCTTSLTNLPYDVSVVTLKYLGVKEKKQLRLVCRYFFDLIMETEKTLAKVWKFKSCVSYQKVIELANIAHTIQGFEAPKLEGNEVQANKCIKHLIEKHQNSTL